MRTYSPFLACLKYAALGSESTSVVISSSRGSGCMTMASLRMASITAASTVGAVCYLVIWAIALQQFHRDLDREDRHCGLGLATAHERVPTQDYATPAPAWRLGTSFALAVVNSFVLCGLAIRGAMMHGLTSLTPEQVRQSAVPCSTPPSP